MIAEVKGAFDNAREILAKQEEGLLTFVQQRTKEDSEILILKFVVKINFLV